MRSALPSATRLLTEERPSDSSVRRTIPEQFGHRRTDVSRASHNDLPQRCPVRPLLIGETITAKRCSANWTTTPSICRFPAAKAHGKCGP